MRERYFKASHLSLLVLALTSLTPIKSSAPSIPTYSNHDSKARNMDKKDDEIQLVFSDLDGTLIHYPKSVSKDNDNENTASSLIYLPASKTGKIGILSKKTEELCNILRTKHNIKLIYVSGMRHTTLIKRIPFLPKVDILFLDTFYNIFF